MHALIKGVLQEMTVACGLKVWQCEITEIVSGGEVCLGKAQRIAWRCTREIKTHIDIAQCAS